jgi:hypothetical protein
MEHQPALPKETPVMSTRPRNRSGRSERTPLGGRLHEMATTRAVRTQPGSQDWPRPHQAGRSVIRNPEIVVFGQLGRRQSRALRPLGGTKSAFARWLYVEALRSGRQVIVLDKSDPRGEYARLLDEMAGCEPLAALPGSVIDPPTFKHARSSLPRVTAGEW